MSVVVPTEPKDTHTAYVLTSQQNTKPSHLKLTSTATINDSKVQTRKLVTAPSVTDSPEFQSTTNNVLTPDRQDTVPNQDSLTLFVLESTKVSQQETTNTYMYAIVIILFCVSLVLFILAAILFGLKFNCCVRMCRRLSSNSRPSARVCEGPYSMQLQSVVNPIYTGPSVQRTEL